MEDTELWKAFPLDTRYEISTHGRLRYIRTQRIRNCSVAANGYRNFVLSYSRSKPKSFDLHAAVALTWLGPRPPKFDISHVDGNKLNNRVDNLVYESRRDNMRRSGTVRYHNGKRKLKAEDVKIIRESDISVIKMAKIYKIARGTVWKIRKRLLWKHLD